MLVDVTFDGVSLVKGANARPDGNGWFVELEQPMPVGTLLQLSGETQAAVRVEHVTEGVGAGMTVSPTGAVENRPAPAPKTEPAAKAAAPAKAEPAAKTEPAKAEPAKAEPAKAKAEPVVAASAAQDQAAADAKKSGDSDGDDESDGGAKGSNGVGKERRKKPRKTVMGH